MDRFDLYNEASPPWCRIRSKFMMALFVSCFFLFQGLLFFLLVSSKEFFEAIRIVLVLSIMMMFAVMGSIFIIINGIARWRQRIIDLNNDYSFRCNDALNYLGWAYEGGSIFSCSMGAVMLFLLASAISIFAIDASMLWILSYLFIFMGCVVVAVMLPAQFRYWRYQFLVKKHVGDVDKSLIHLPDRLMGSARSYAVSNGYYGIGKAIHVAFLGNYFVDMININKQAVLLNKKTKHAVNSPQAPRKRL